MTVALALVGAAGEAGAAPAAEMPWSAVSRFGGDADGDGRIDPGPGGRGPQVVELDRIPIVLAPSAAICAAEGARWTLDGRLVSAERVGGSDRCRRRVATPEGTHTIEVRFDGRREVARVETDDLLVVALGDSVAAGQGNPEGGAPGGWLDRRCYRSSLAGFEQAAWRFGQQFESDGGRSSITFVSLACSGAEIEAGLLGPQGEGRSARAAQVARLGGLAAARGDGADDEPTVDAVLLSIGGNDIGFAGIVGNCALPGSCQKRRGAAVAAHLERLPDQLARLRESLVTTVPGTPVLVSEYFDPTRDANGRFCGRGLAATSEDEMRWAYEDVLLPLNAALEQSVGERTGWRFVSGIAADFRTHGYCTPRDRAWVVKALESAGRQLNHLGTMHPDRDGHEAIAARVAVALAETLGVAAPAAFGTDDGGDVDWGELALILVAPFIPAALLLICFYMPLRALRLLRPTSPSDPLGARAVRRAPSPRSRQPSLRRGLWLALLTLAALGGILLLSELAGRLIVLARFWTANLPASQAVDAVGAGELTIRGSGAIGLFVALGLAAVGVAWLLDGRGSAARPSRRGLVAIGLAELTVAVQLGDFRPEQGRELLLGLIAAGLLVYFLVERGLEAGAWLRRAAPRGVSRAEFAWEATGDRLGRLGKATAGEAAALAYRAIPYLLLGAAIVGATHAEGTDRVFFVVAPFLLAALAFLLPGSSAAPALRRNPTDDELACLRGPRIALALAGIACIAILIVRDEAWLASSAAIAAALGLLCLAVAVAVPGRFGPYGIAIFATVLAFGAATSILRDVDSPEL